MSSIPDVLRDASASDLDDLHAAGSAPTLDSLTGTLPGAVLSGSLALPLVRDLRPWRGKVFDHGTAGVFGLNRLGIGPLEIRRFTFEARVGRSLFGDRDVVLLDHDREGNPDYVRRFHDELVAIEPGVYLATSHHRRAKSLRFLCHFALWDPMALR